MTSQPLLVCPGFVLRVVGMRHNDTHQLPGAAAVAYSALFSASISSLRSWRLHSGNHDSHNEESSGKQARNREAIAPKCALCGPDP